MIRSAKSLTGHDLPAFITPDGTPRLLAAFPAGEVTQPLFAATVIPVIPQSEWFEFDRTRNDVPILNQGSHGSCVGHGSASGVMLCRSAAGMSFQLLSPTWIYAHINGGRDAGSVPADAVDFAKTTGACLMDQCGEDTVLLRQIRDHAGLEKTAARFRLDEVYQVETWEQRVTAAILGYHLIDTVHVGNNYQTNAEGVAGASRGTGNHCVLGGEGLKKLQDGQWAIKFRNSWSTQWGVGGWMYHTEDHYSAQPQAECFAVQVVMSDPDDPTELPAVV